MKEFEKIYDEEFTSIDNIESLLLTLRKSGASMIDTVKLIQMKTLLPLKDADKLVLNSETWKDSKDQIIELRDEFWSQFFE